MKQQFLDKIIVKTLKSLDRDTFSNKDKVFLFKELAYLLKWGVGVVEAIDIIQGSSDNFAVKEIAKNIKLFLHKGKTLSYAMNRLPNYFDEWDYSIIKAGEESGNLAFVLKSLADEYSYLGETKNKYIGALMYPIILIILAVVSVFALFMFVLPGIFSIADSFTGINLPWTTLFLRDVSDFLLLYWKQILITIAGVIFVWSIFFSSNAGKQTWYRVVMWLPLIGRMSKYFYLVKFCRYTKVMLNAGMSYVQTFTLLRDVLHIWAYQKMIEDILEWIQKWESIYSVLKYQSDLIPVNVATLIKVWEETANLDASLGNVLHMYQEELDAQINRLAKVMEPIMLVIIWWVVVFVALAVFGLIMQIMEWVWI